MSKTMNLQTWDLEKIRREINNEYSNGKNNHVYTDASYQVQNNSLGIGVHIKDKEGNRFSYYSGKISEYYNDFERFYYEDIALWLGLKLCLANNIFKPIVYIDSQDVYKRYVRIIKIPKNERVSHKVINSNMLNIHVDDIEKIWNEIRELYYQLRIVRLNLINSHVGIFGNEEADKMATKGRTLTEKLL
jgi:ribonuclease HI